MTETPAPVYAEPEVATPAKPGLITSHIWKADVVCYRCETCGYFENDRDTLVIHVLTHFPADEQSGVLDELTKEQ